MSYKQELYRVKVFLLLLRWHQVLGFGQLVYLKYGNSYFLDRDKLVSSAKKMTSVLK